MNIVLDCDEVLLDTLPVIARFYRDCIDPNGKVSGKQYSSTWNVWDDPVNKSVNRTWQTFLQEYTESPYFTIAQPLWGAVNGVEKLKLYGNKLWVVSSVFPVPHIQEMRTAHLRRLFGKSKFQDVILTDHFGKQKVMKEIAADAVVDDGMSNVGDALEINMHGLLKKCPANASMINTMRAGRTMSENSWHVKNMDLLREKAIIVRNWREIIFALERIR